VGSVENLLIMIMPIAGAMLLVYGIFQVIMDLKSAKQRRIMDRLTESRSDRQREVKESLLRKRASDLQGNALEGVVAKLQVVRWLQRVLDQANVDWAASKLLVNLTITGMLVGLGLMLVQVSLPSCLAASAAVVGLPLVWLVHRRKKWIKKLVNQLPDVFELLSQALRAGHSLGSGVQLISQQMPDPIASEFARVFYEQNLGIKIEEALLNMADRVDQMDVRFFVTAVLIQRQTGGDLAEVLDNIGKVIKDRIQLLGQVQALTAEGRLSGWVLLALPVVVFFVAMFVSPDSSHVLIGTETGRIMLGSAIGMDLIGLAMIKKIVNIKV